jgi:hypothetical protein
MGVIVASEAPEMVATVRSLECGRYESHGAARP